MSRSHSNKLVWIHASSYGEFEMSKPIIRELRKGDPDIRFVVSFYSPSGFERIELDTEIFCKLYLPLDLRFLHLRFLRLARPSAFIFMKYDFWFNLLRALKAEKIPYYFVGLHLEKDSYLFSSFMRPFLKLIASASRLYVHSQNSAGILSEKGIHKTRLLGDLRILQSIFTAESEELKISWQVDAPCVVYGSVSPLELNTVIRTIRSLSDYNHILALHDVENALIDSIKAELGKCSLLSETQNPDSNILILDGYGKLKFVYKNAALAYVGGGFEKGPHNILEPMIFDVPVFIGPNTRKFPFAQEAASKGVIHILEKLEDMPEFTRSVLSSDDQLNTDRIKEYITDYKPDMQELIEELSLNLQHVG